MKRWFTMLSLLGFLGVGGYALAQYPYDPPQTVVNAPQNQTVVNPPPMAPMVPVHPPHAPVVAPVASVPGYGPPIHEWREGVHEEWRTIHEIRPVRDYWPNSYPSSYTPQYQPTNGFYYYPNTGCWQRDLYPHHQQQQVVYPQWYTQPYTYPYRRW